MGEWSDWYAREDPSTWVLAEVLKRRAAEHPDRDYLKFADSPWVSYGEINARSNRIANALISRGVQPGESVSVMLPNCEDFIPIWFGILKAGAVMSSINTAYKGDFLSWTINLVEARKLIVSDEFLDRLDLIKGELPTLEHVIVWESGKREGPDPLAAQRAVGGPDGRPPTPSPMASPTSGPTTPGSCSPRARPAAPRASSSRTPPTTSRRAACWRSSRRPPASRSSRWPRTPSSPACRSSTPTPRCSRATRRWWPAARVAYTERFSSSRFWQQIIDAEATVFNSIGAVSYFIWNIPTSDLDRAHKVHTCFAAPAPKDIYNEFQERFGVKFIEGYGLTETGMATYMDPTKPGVPGSMGKANPGYEVTIVEPGTDRPLPPGSPGEIVVDMKIPNIVMRAYYGMPEKTAEDFRNLKLHTGDLGRMDEDGYFYFMDRVKDYIRRRGENVSSMEVEKQVGDHPGIKEAAAIGVKAGESVAAEDEIMVVCIPEGEAPDPVELTHWLAERIPYFMVPRYIRFVDSLPKTPTERVQKVKLREEGITADTFDREAAGITIKR